MFGASERDLRDVGSMGDDSSIEYLSVLEDRDGRVLICKICMSEFRSITASSSLVPADENCDRSLFDGL